MEEVCVGGQQVFTNSGILEAGKKKWKWQSTQSQELQRQNAKRSVFKHMKLCTMKQSEQRSIAGEWTPQTGETRAIDRLQAGECEGT